MIRASWKVVEGVCAKALELPLSRRAAFLGRACAGDSTLRSEVDALLAGEDRAVSFLEVPALEWMTDPSGSQQAPVEPEPQLPAGMRIGPYLILECIGGGGMGQVYRARDSRLDRDVALKFLPAGMARDSSALARFRVEAHAASALNHPNICTLHDTGEHEGQPYLVMELLEGQTLKQRLEAGPLPVGEVLELAVQIGDALHAAHSKGIVHCDIKPGNLFLTPDGQAKILDFGLSKLLLDTPPLPDTDQEAARQTTAGEATIGRSGAVMGTVPYMSPEQVTGKPIDPRSDVFSLGAVLYEMLTRTRAFPGETRRATLDAILHNSPPLLQQPRKGAPADLRRIVGRCLEKDPDARYASATELWKDLADLKSRLARRRIFTSSLRKPRFAIPAVFVLAAVVTVIGLLWVRNSRIHWARTVALPEIGRLTREQRPCAALRLIQQAERYLPGDQELERFRQRFTARLTVRTDPPGADFFVRDYLDVSEHAEWMHMGRTPLESVAVPASLVPHRITKTGFETLEGTIGMREGLRGAEVREFTLALEGTSPPGMIRLPAQAPNMVTLVLAHPTRILKLDAFWLDKYEVTNRQFMKFVDQGGYEKREYWKHPFIKDGRVVTWDEAMAGFVDATGRPGPATWTSGTYPKDRGDFPVGGVSWHEAAAYAEFEGKSLPTVHHWRSAAGLGTHAGILQVSNYVGNGPARVGSHRGLSPHGNYDMAGNVREWCWNRAGEERYALGGAWSDPSYTFYCPETRPPMDRSPGNGFRCARYDSPPSGQLTGPVPLLIRDRRGDKPAINSVFEVYRAIHQYDRGDLKPAIEMRDDSHPDWRLEKVSFQAAYADERVNALLYLPKHASPPYQIVVYFPGAYCLDVRTRPPAELPRIEHIPRYGRALMYPTYKGTCDRSFGGTFEALRRQPNVWREMALQWASDLGRSLDYLETRADIDAGGMAYLGNSMGAVEGPRFMALNPRLRVGILLYAGCWERGWPPSAVDPFHFAPRVKAPILMVNGKDDFIFPLATSQRPLFQLLGTPENNKRHLVVDGGHAPLDEEIILEMLGWLDRHLGPVNSLRREVAR